MSFRDVAMKEFLVCINLEQYFPNFQDFGYNRLQDCVGINNRVLQQIGISPTGHRRRILKQLEAVFAERQAKPTPIENQKTGDTEELGNGCLRTLGHDSDTHILNSKKAGITSWRSREWTNTDVENNDTYEETHELGGYESLEDKGSVSSDLGSLSCHARSCSTAATPGMQSALKNVVPENISWAENSIEKGQPASIHLQLDCGPEETTSSPSSAFSSSEMKFGKDEQIKDLGLQNSSDSPPVSPFVEFKGEMVENDLYNRSAPSPTKTTPRPTRSFILRHRPVPEIPGSSTRSIQERRNMNSLNILLSESLILQKRDPAEEKPPSISPYGETFLHGGSEYADACGKEFSGVQEYQDEKSSEVEILPSNTCIPNEKNNECKAFDVVTSELLFQEDKSVPLNHFASESEYSTVKECSQYVKRGKPKISRNFKEPRTGNCDLSAKEQSYLGSDPMNSPKDSITPYACFYGTSTKKVKEGWLDKQSPQGKHMFQKRWVKFDGDSVSYYSNDKEVYSKGIILLSAISIVRVHGDNKFEVVTAHRIFIFRAEKEDERNDWIQTILSALHTQREISRPQSAFVPPEKSGYLELKGYKAKIFMLLQGNNVWLCKNDQDFKTGYGITVIPMNVANVRQVDRTTKQAFEIITPYRSFIFTAESEKEKQEWIEALQQSIAETLSDYEVADKIWLNETNRTCADCKAPDPDWASINLCVIICKKCADNVLLQADALGTEPQNVEEFLRSDITRDKDHRGQHRSLGPRDSKVRSLKMDASIWNNELIELFIVIGNKRANSFWEGNLQPDEELAMDAPTDRRLTFITQKYKEGKFRKTALLYKTKDELNKALCAAVVKQDVLETMMVLFSGADVMCTTGDPVHSTPYLLAKKSGQRLQMEFLHHNKFSDFPNYDGHSDNVSYQDSSSSAFLCDYLYKVSFSATKLFTDRKLKEDCNKSWCALESGFLSYYENKKTTSLSGTIDISEVICLALHKADAFLHMGALFAFEIYLLPERFFLFGSETAHSYRKWTQAIAKHFVPAVVKCLVERDYEVIGQLYYKDCHNLDNWKKGWFAIEKSSLYFCQEVENPQEDSIYLRRLQELTISSITQNGEKIDVLLLVEKGRTLYIHGHTNANLIVWHRAIEKAASTDGNVLEDQQLSKNDVPIIVNSCIAFVTQYGLGSKHIYLKGGNLSHVSELLESFKRDARSVKLRVGTNQLEDVADTLKCFLSEIDDALLTKELYPFWISALDTLDENERVKKYSTFIRTLPPVNRATLAALMEHLYRVQKCSEINQMDPHNLAMAFSSCLFQTKGQTSEEVDVIEDLIINYVHLFDVHADQVKKMDIENSFITKWKDTQVSQAGDLLIEVYVERKEPDCSIIIRVSPAMEAEEFTSDILGQKNITPQEDDMWATFEVIENGELERPLHYTENVLEQILHWSSLPNPGSAYLVIKKFLRADTVKLYNETHPKGSIKACYLRYKEEPSKLLLGNKFQERYFVLQEGNLLLYKDAKSSKPEKVLPVESLKLYLGVKKKCKPPTNWGLTLYAAKQHWHLCCDGQESQLEWMISIFIAQHNNLRPPDGVTRKQSITKNPKIGGLPLIPIQHERNIPKNKVGTPENSKLESENDLTEDKKGLKQKLALVAQCLERKEEKAWNRVKKHRSLICLDDTGQDDDCLHQRPFKESKSPKKSDDKAHQTHLESDNQLPANVIQELSTVLQKHRVFHEET